MGYGREPEPDVTFEGRVEVTTAKARLVFLTYPPPEQVWLPKSQTVSMEEVGENTYIFTVTGWWAAKNGITDR